MIFRDKFPADQYPFSDELCLFMDNNIKFFNSLKLANSDRFKFIPLIFTSHIPISHSKYRDEVIGVWYLDKTETVCKTHNRIYLFKQDFIVNINHRNKDFISYSASNNDGPHVKPITDFFILYGENGRFYHNGKNWQHHYGGIEELPDEPRLKLLARDYLNVLKNQNLKIV